MEPMNDNGRHGNHDSEAGAHGPTRRQLVVGGAAAAVALASSGPSSRAGETSGKRPLAVASANGREAVIEAVRRMQAGRAPVEAAVRGVSLVEDDPDDVTVGYGGLPNAEGVVQLDACCMDGPTMRAGAVAAVERIRHPARLALEVARRTSRVLLVADGAQRFARALGMPEEELLTERARKIWLYWKAHMSGRDDWLPAADESDDPDVQWFISRYGAVRPTGTINVCAVDAAGDLGGTTTTSGLAFKIPGRVGDSPLIGAGLFVDNEVGAAGSTGRGESVIQVAGSHTVVELMRRGQAPTAACLGALERVVQATRVSYLKDDKGRPAFDVKFYAVNKDGDVGAAAIWSGGHYVWCGGNLQPVVADCAYLYEEDESEG
jgi:N4-(beta-N-acetylglucosaminyl)-L-asparaginase